MKYIFLLFISFAFQTNIFANNLTEKDQKLSGIFIPEGFDSDDRVQVIVSGYFDSLCEKIGPYTSMVDGNTIHLHQSVYQYPGNCSPVKNKFYQMIEIGMIAAGQYKIIDDVTESEIGTIHVSQAKNPINGTDQYLYAPISDAFLVKSAKTKNIILVLSGIFPKDCFSFSEVRSTWGARALAIQPIVNHKPFETCKNEKTPFKKLVNLKKKLPSEFLLHVRGMNGQALNKIIQVESIPTVSLDME